MNTKTIKFDLNKYKLYEKIKAKQGDTKSRFLLFQLLDGSIPFNLKNRSVRAYMIKPDGKEIFNDLIVNNYKLGYCTLELTNQVLAVPGTVKIELMITEEERKLTSSIFELEVIKSINKEKSIVSTNEFTALLNGLAALSEYDNYKNAVKEMEETKADKEKVEEKFGEVYEQLDNMSYIVPLGATTTEIQNILDTKSKILFLDGDYVLKKPIYFRSNTSITFSPGTVFKMASGSFTGNFDCAINIVKVENIELKNTLKVIMNKEEYTEGEWRHGVNIQSAKFLKASRIEVYNTGGDGVYFGSNDNITTNENIDISEIVVDNAKRNGVSFITGKNIFIDNMIIKNTKGTNPASGVDFEPNANTNCLQNIVINNLYTYENAKCGLIFELMKLKDSTELTLITINNFYSYADGSSSGIDGALDFRYGNKEDTKQLYGNINIKKAIIHNPKGRGVNFLNYTSKAVELKLENITIYNPGSLLALTSNADLSGFSMYVTSSNNIDKIGNINFINCKVIDTRTTPRLYIPFYFVSSKEIEKIRCIDCDGENQTSKNAGLYQISNGSFIISSTSEQTKEFSSSNVISNYQGMILTNTSADVITLTLPSVLSFPKAIFKFRVTNGVINVKCQNGQKILRNGTFQSGDYGMRTIGDYLVVKATPNGWEIIEEISQPRNTNTFNPSYVGQIAIVNGVAYIATTHLSSGWKAITN